MAASRLTRSGPRSSTRPPDGVTFDAPAAGICIAQPERGYRYSVDAFWLAGFALEQVPRGSALDLCTGSGIVAFLLASRGLQATGVDVQPAWTDLWSRSTADNPPELHLADARSWSGAYDLVTCNPPFHAAGTGPLSPNPLRAAAHTELNGTLLELWQAARRLSREWVVFVLPARRITELPTATRSVTVGPVALLAWGPGSPSHVELTREEAQRWIQVFRR